MIQARQRGKASRMEPAKRRAGRSARASGQAASLESARAYDEEREIAAESMQAAYRGHSARTYSQRRRRALHEVASRIVVGAVARWLARRKVANARKYAMGRGWRVRVR